MNIKQAKEYIKNSVRIYLKKDEFGEYRIPIIRQRPIFLLGAPGIGKTAIMEQIAQELGIALVSYSMTHHTRQSALGLPFIEHKVYGGRETEVSEYTMSEIIASLYETMEESGLREGILFLDEINCVSETLAPSMLQFLQYKVFGRHRVPDGWIIVTAGNPPEYNKSVREFDVVTYDRLKVLEVEPDLKAWKEYAAEKHIHQAILNYLDLKKDHFYHMEMTAKGRSFVTARGWEDLSEILLLYEEEKLPVDETLVGQYLRNERIVREFTAYYDLYRKYQKDYAVGEILTGKDCERAVERARAAAFDERLSLLGMLMDRVQADMREVCEQAAYLSDLKAPLKAVGMLGRGKPAGAEQSGAGPAGTSGAESSGVGPSGGKPAKESAAGAEPSGAGSGAVEEMLEKQIQGRRKSMEALRRANSLSDADRRRARRVIAFLEESKKALQTQSGQVSGAEAFAFLKARYEAAVSALRGETGQVGRELHALFDFAERAFAGGNEMLILVTGLTANPYSAQFIATFGSPDYQRHTQELMLSERQEELKNQIADLKL